MIQILFQCGEVPGLNHLRPNWTWLGGFKFSDEVVEVVVEIFRLLGVDTPKGGFCQSNAICNTFADSMDDGGDVVGGDGMVVVSLKAIPSQGRRVTMLLESVFREFDALGDVVVHLIHSGDQIVRFDQWARSRPNMTRVASDKFGKLNSVEIIGKVLMLRLDAEVEASGFLESARWPLRPLELLVMWI
jgi:hypothetical protein